MLEWMGFASLRDFIVSLVKPEVLLKAWAWLAFFTPLMVLIETLSGLNPAVFFCFIAINIVEFYTGVKASAAEGIPMQSVKMHRFLVKLVCYIAVISVVFQFSKNTGGDIAGTSSKIVYGTIHWLIFNYVSLILIRSIFENLHRMGVKEARIIFGILDNKFTRFLAYIASPADDEKSQRH